MRIEHEWILNQIAVNDNYGPELTMNIMDLPYELRYKIYEMTWERNCLGSSQMMGVCEALRLRYNEYFDWS